MLYNQIPCYKSQPLKAKITMTSNEITHPLRISDIPKATVRPFDIAFTTSEMETVSGILSALSVKKMRIRGEISPSGSKDWILTAQVGATVTQSCVVSLKPVQTRVDVPVTLKYAADYQFNEDDSVSEMDPDENIEPLVDEIDLVIIAIEALALVLPDYPRLENATLETAIFTEPGAAPMTDDDAKPFASLASLKDKLTKEGK